MKPYYEIPVLKHLYLEDSYVIGIETDKMSAQFEIEFVLTEKHEDYHPPLQGEQYCYKKGILKFDNCQDILWHSVKHVRNIDKNLDIDMGNIDAYHFEDTKHCLEGDWGKIEIHSDDIGLIWS